MFVEFDDDMAGEHVCSTESQVDGIDLCEDASLNAAGGAKSGEIKRARCYCKECEHSWVSYVPDSGRQCITCPNCGKKSGRFSSSIIFDLK